MPASTALQVTDPYGRALDRVLHKIDEGLGMHIRKNEPKAGTTDIRVPVRSNGLSLAEIPQTVDALVAVQRASHRPQTQFQPLNEWEGVVTLVDDTQFHAKLFDQTDPGTPREQAEFDIEDVSPNDRPLLRSGAVFRWVIGKRVTERGSIVKESRLVFRRLPAFTARELERARSEAEDLIASIPSA